MEMIRLVQNFAVWVFASAMKDPVPKAPVRGLRVALLTTIVPAKEPLEIVEQTLIAMRKVEYDGQVDVWILDEGDDDRVKAMAARLGVHHFSRKGRPEYNQAHGEFRAKTKSGNHNSWRAEHEHEYHVVAQMDPDHVPYTWFLKRILGYFRDPDVGFVVAPQVYGNMHENWITRGPRSSSSCSPVSSSAAATAWTPRSYRYQPCLPARGLEADRWLPGLDHRRSPDQHAAAGHVQPRDRQPVEGRVHPGRAGRGARPRHVVGLLQPAEALGLRHLGDPNCQRRCAPESG